MLSLNNVEGFVAPSLSGQGLCASAPPPPFPPRASLRVPNMSVDASESTDALIYCRATKVSMIELSLSKCAIASTCAIYVLGVFCNNKQKIQGHFRCLCLVPCMALLASGTIRCCRQQ